MSCGEYGDNVRKLVTAINNGKYDIQVGKPFPQPENLNNVNQKEIMKSKYFYIIDEANQIFFNICFIIVIIFVISGSNLSSNFIEIDKLSKSVDSDSLLQYSGNQFSKPGKCSFKVVPISSL